MRGWADVGLWAAVCCLAKMSLLRPKTTFARLTQSQAISQSIVFNHFQINERYKRASLFSFFETLFYTHLPIPLPWWSKRSAGGRRSTSKSTCVVPAWTLTAFGNRSASSLSKFSDRENSDLGNGSFWVKIHDSEHVDRCSWNIREFDRINRPLTSEMFTFLEIIRVPSLKSRSSLAPPVQHRNIYIGVFIRVCRVGICLLSRKQLRRSWPKNLISKATFDRRFLGREASGMPINGLAKASHLNAVGEPWLHASQKRSTPLQKKIGENLVSSVSACLFPALWMPCAEFCEQNSK